MFFIKKNYFLLKVLILLLSLPNLTYSFATSLNWFQLEAVSSGTVRTDLLYGAFNFYNFELGFTLARFGVNDVYNLTDSRTSEEFKSRLLTNSYIPIQLRFYPIFLYEPFKDYDDLAKVTSLSAGIDFSFLNQAHVKAAQGDFGDSDTSEKFFNDELSFCVFRCFLEFSIARGHNEFVMPTMKILGGYEKIGLWSPKISKHIRYAPIPNGRFFLALNFSLGVSCHEYLTNINKPALPLSINTKVVKSKRQLAKISGYKAKTNIRSLIRIASNKNAETSSRYEAIKILGSLNDSSAQMFLYKLALKEEYPVSDCAINNLADQNYLLQIFLNAKKRVSATNAVSKITLYNPLIDSLKERDYPRNLISFINNNDILYAIFEKSPSSDLKTFIVPRLRNQLFLLSIVQTEKEVAVRDLAFQQLDRSTLFSLAGGTRDTTLLIAATTRTGQLSWSNAFSEYPAAYVLNAISMYNPNDYNSELIFALCNYYIKLGNTSNITRLGKILQNYGNKELAEIYINSGQPDLSVIGENWASLHNYRIYKSPSSQNFVQWGDGRK